ncbi:MAG: lipopolysaccharide biosynthesis protein [Gammaproteobacteria bacterium]|nr:lipopolysaccharide biosynthesis protein [Gammaproteobacteria bacterium]
MNMAVEFEEEDTKSIGEYVNAFKRRKWQFAVPAAAVFILACLVAVFWPSTYQSSATILIEEQQIPKDLVQSTITSYAAQQIEVIKARIMTTKNIMSMVEKFNLYDEDERRTMSRSEIVQEFVENVGLDVISAGVIDPRSGRPTEATIAFSISYTHENPTSAQKVVSELVNLYLNENLRDRNEKTSNTSSFLQAEAVHLNSVLVKSEGELAIFKAANEGSLPELYEYNLNIVQRTERELLDASLRLKELEKRKLQLESDLAQMSKFAPTVMPNGEQVLSDYDRLKALRSSYRQKIAVYSSKHPDVVRLEREINVLEQELGGGLSAEDHARRVKAEQDKLSALKQKYTPDHPKVLAQQRVVEQVANELPSQTVVADKALTPDNPAYVLTDTQLQATIVEMQILHENKVELEKKIAKYERLIVKAPNVEKEYTALNRDYDNAQMKYQEIKAKLMSAELAQTLERGRKGERFTLIDPPELPEEPVSPNRLAIMFLGIIAALGAGAGVVIIAEAMEPSVRGARELNRILGVAPLVVVPLIEWDDEAEKSLFEKYKWFAAAALLALIGLLCFHFLIKPLDVTWFMLLRKLGVG